MDRDEAIVSMWQCIGHAEASGKWPEFATGGMRLTTPVPEFPSAQ